MKSISFQGVAAKHKGDIIKAHLPGKEGINVGFDHRMYCKVLNEAEVEKQTRTCERYNCEEDESSRGSSDNDNDNDDVSAEDESDYSEYETESSSSSIAESLDQGSEPSKRGSRSPKSNKLFDEILGNYRN